MVQDRSGWDKVGATDLDGLGFDESMEVLRLARSAFSGMCKVIADESGMRVVPSFAPDQADWCRTNEHDGVADWSIRVGFDGCSAYRIEGTYEELCREWLKGPESFHGWLGHAVLLVASEVVGDDGHGMPDFDFDELPSPSARSLTDARIGLLACGYEVSPARMPDYMRVCSFVAWKGDTLVFVAVTDADDEDSRAEQLAWDVEEWRNRSDNPRDDVAAIVVSVSDGTIGSTDVEI